jgi:hypothetical protein
MSDSPNSRSAWRVFTTATQIRFALSLCTVMLLVQSAAIQAQFEPAAPEAEKQDALWSKPQDLLEGELATHWKHFSSVDATKFPDVWKRFPNDDKTKTELVCTGTPRGYLYTNQKYAEFDLSFEWRYDSDPNGNSGVLVFTQDDQRLWPTSIQIQLHQPEAGSVFPSGDAETDGPHKKEGLANAVGEWNTCHIVSRSGRVLVHINGDKAGEVKGCKPATGRIAIQSEGSEVHFRRVMIRTPAAAKTVPEPEASDETVDSSSSERPKAPKGSEG